MLATRRPGPSRTLGTTRPAGSSRPWSTPRCVWPERRCRAFGRSEGGTPRNISSIAGLTTAPFAGHYTGAKHALEALSDALRMETGRRRCSRWCSSSPVGSRQASGTSSSATSNRMELPALATEAPTAARSRRNGGRPPLDGERRRMRQGDRRGPDPRRRRYLVGMECRLAWSVSHTELREGSGDPTWPRALAHRRRSALASSARGRRPWRRPCPTGRARAPGSETRPKSSVSR